MHVLADYTGPDRWLQFWSVFSSFGHISTEIAVTILFDGLVGAVLWPLAKRAVRRHDRNTHHIKEEV